jgi:hypothetical protein
MPASRHIVPALLLLVAGAALWIAGYLEQRTIDARRQFLMLRRDTPLAQYDAVERAGRFVPNVAAAGRWRAGLRAHRAEAQYWLGDYDALTAGGAEGSRDNDPVRLMLSANAAYRQTAEDLPGPAAIERLESIAAQYLDVLERDPTLVDAAYNYEFVVRTRGTIARGRAGNRRGQPSAAPNAAPGSTVHGAPGVPPSDPDTGDFKIIVPQRPEERRQQPDAGLSGAKVRKG